MPAPALRTAEEWIQEAQHVLAATDSRTFNLQAQSRVEACLRMAELARAGKGPDIFGKKHDYASIADRQMRRNAELRRDPAANAFFSGQDVGDKPLMSDFGTRLVQQPFHVQGRAVGKVVQMRNLNLAPAERRTYVALNETTSSAGSAAQDYIGFYGGDAKLLSERLEYVQRTTTFLDSIGADDSSAPPA
jgi:hypothetical protein